MASRFASAKNSIAECDRCGFRYKLTQLKHLVIKTKNVNILVCPECWEPDQPQLQLGLYPVNDPQAVRNPRPDTSYYAPGNDGAGGSRIIQWGWAPVGGARIYDTGLTPNDLITNTSLGQVTVDIVDGPPLSALSIYTGLYTQAYPFYSFNCGILYNDPSYGVFPNFGVSNPYPPTTFGLDQTYNILSIINNYDNDGLYGAYLGLEGIIELPATGKMTFSGGGLASPVDFLFADAYIITSLDITTVSWGTAFPWGGNANREYTVTFSAS